MLAVLSKGLVVAYGCLMSSVLFSAFVVGLRLWLGHR